MDWSGQPNGAQGKLKVAVWHELVADSTGPVELPTNAEGKTPTDVTIVWQSTDPAVKPEIVNFTQENLVSAIAALISAVPLRQRLSPADLVLTADSFTHSYALCQTLAALFMHSSIVINSVAVPGVDLALAQRGAAPTVIIASAETMATLHRKETAGVTSLAQNFGRYTQTQTMSAGRMPTDGLLFKLLAPSSTKHTPGKLRLIFVSERLGGGSPPITSTMLSDLRLFTRSRIIYALTASKVAGAVSQSNVFDYRRDDGIAHSHFGIPLSSVEVKLTNRTDSEVATNEPRGELLVSGPAVQGGKAKLDARARIRSDCTLAYA
jgi:acyl-CoA synthetase (AMP-forming)/AMP-acid ligase II